MSLLSEFKEFALKGNVMDMAVGVIIGAAFGNIVTALTDNFINPLIAVIFGGNSEDGLQIGGQFVIRGVAFNYGAFLSAVVNFLIIALVLFLILKAINTASAKAAALAAAKLKKDKEEEAAKPAEPSEEVKLLTEIKDILASQNK
ncbi:MAG: large conductance mechanosensitive channel protein MscL [Clostridiales bacterium]|jgi:large conductance mechanosensitive channel|nr:large conductance mechanosensitive channel protein MscL [Clostridiales bacterium]MBP3810144.1 large conductance mechanosensitive channel protein MscL [Clostridiales bacterium]MBR4494234.1 large conductance mechanosensitive channel protein MscL [Clostridiales bacterium]